MSKCSDGCIIADMSAACRPDDEACYLFHRRLAGLLNGVSELAQAHAGNEPVESCHTCLFGPEDSPGCVEHINKTTGPRCWVEENVK